MTAEKYRSWLSYLLTRAIKELDGDTIVSGLISGLSDILALIVLQERLNQDEVIEITQHDLDIAFSKALKDRRDAKCQTA
jgi:hypothetical protein